MSTLLVHLDNLDTGAVSFKPEGIKGARWRKAKSVYQANLLADDVLPPSSPEAPRTIEYVVRMA